MLSASPVFGAAVLAMILPSCPRHFMCGRPGFLARGRGGGQGIAEGGAQVFLAVL